MAKFSLKTRQVKRLYELDSDVNIAFPLFEEGYSDKRTLFVTSSPVNSKYCNNSLIPTISPQKIKLFLGQELDCIIFDATTNFDVNGFAAIIGCLVGGGELILILPKSLKGVDNLNYNCLLQQDISPTLARLHFQIKQYQHLIISSSSNDSNSSHRKKSNSELPESFEQEQQLLIKKIKSCAIGHARRPLIISAARGRGKSASIGMALAAIVFEKNKNVIVTAPSKNNTKILFQYYEKTLAKLLDSRTVAENFHPLSYYRNRVIFQSPDELIKHRPHTDLIVLDEAGAIPIQQLKIISKQCNRLIFSTTTDGYEGNGRGFDIRFVPFLIKQFSQPRFATINNPIRWRINDPLENMVNEALIQQPYTLDRPEQTITNAIPNITGTNTNKNVGFSNSLKYTRITAEELWNDQDKLNQIISLLISAHYQTRPSDLERILSDSKLSVFIVLDRQTVIATALICEEGPFNKQQCENIEQGKLRVPGNLLPQSLMAHQGILAAGKLNFWRIMRIATLQNHRRLSVASNLMEHIFDLALTSEVDIIGTSFAMENNVLNFWYKQQFTCSRIAIRKDSSSGNLPCEMLRLVNNTSSVAMSCIETATKLFLELFYYNLTTSLKDFDTECITTLITRQAISSLISRQLLTEFQLKEIQRYCNKARSFEMVAPQIQLFLKYYGLTKQSLIVIEPIDRQILIRKSFCLNDWLAITAEFNLNGKNQTKEKLRSAIETLLKYYLSTRNHKPQ